MIAWRGSIRAMESSPVRINGSAIEQTSTQDLPEVVV